MSIVMDEPAQLVLGDSMENLKELPDNSIDSGLYTSTLLNWGLGSIVI